MDGHVEWNPQQWWKTWQSTPGRGLLCKRRLVATQLDDTGGSVVVVMDTGQGISVDTLLAAVVWKRGTLGSFGGRIMAVVLAIGGLVVIGTLVVTMGRKREIGRHGGLDKFDMLVMTGVFSLGAIFNLLKPLRAFAASPMIFPSANKFRPVFLLFPSPPVTPAGLDSGGAHPQERR